MINLKKAIQMKNEVENACQLDKLKYQIYSAIYANSDYAIHTIKGHEKALDIKAFLMPFGFKCKIDEIFTDTDGISVYTVTIRLTNEED